MPSLADKFMQRRVDYGLRLVELQQGLSIASEEERATLIEEVETIAHNLAGTAAMFGQRSLGEQAAEAEDNLKAKPENGSAWIDDLIDALGRAA